MAAKLSAARPAQDELLRLDALTAEGYWGIPISRNASLFRHKREAATREADELNDLHRTEIALAHANVVNCDMAATALHKAVMTEIATQRAELEAADATDRRIAAAMPATPPESEEEPTNSSDAESSSSEETSWEQAAGGLSAAEVAAAAAAAAAEEEEESCASLESTDSSEAEQGSTDSSEAESSVLSPSEDEWEDFSKADFWGLMEAGMDAAAAASAAEDAAGSCSGNARSRRVERRAAERRRQQEAVEMVAALEEPSAEPADFWASMEAAVDAVVTASAAEEATAAEHLDSVRIRDITLTERRQAAQEGLRRAGLLPGGQGGRGELEAGGTPLTFDPGRPRRPLNTEVRSSTLPPPDIDVRSSTRRPPGH